jgi:hypothetical protein
VEQPPVGNIFNFAPQTQRDGGKESKIDQFDSLPVHMTSSIAAKERGGNKNHGNHGKLSLQPKLINPPAKLQ